MAKSVHSLAIALLLLVGHFGQLGCASSPDPEDAGPQRPAPGTVESLIDNHQWSLVAAADDPWYPADGDVPTVCTEVETGIEAFPDPEPDWFEITTAKCAYATARTQILVPAFEGGSLRLRLWRFAMKAADGPFDLELAFGDPPEVFWKKEFPAPSFESELICDDIPIPRFVPQGEDLWWHLKNHGDNTWGMIELSAEYCDPPCLPSCPQ
jgi:hypothetical protein